MKYNTEKKLTPTLRSKDVPYSVESPVDYYELHGFSGKCSPEERAEYNAEVAVYLREYKLDLEAQEAVDRERDGLERLQSL